MILVRKIVWSCLALMIICGLGFNRQAFGANIILKDLQANTVNLESFNGSPRILIFWTTWCPYCRAAIKSLTQISAQLQQEGVLVFAIDVNESPVRVRNFLKNSPVNFKVLLDGEAQLASSYNVNGVPTYVLINRAGRIVAKRNSFPSDYKDLLAR